MLQNPIPRRTFLAKSTATVVASSVAAMLPRSAWAQPSGANESVGLGIVGLGIKGTQHLQHFGSLPGVRIVALCDADQARIDEHATTLRDQNQSVNTYQDFRKLLEDKAVDAVVIATPNHWHALMTIWACQAGKDVYVEKPVSHSIWEGARMLEAEKKYGRIIQGGTQNRSNLVMDEGIAYLREGNLGAIKGIHAVRYRERGSIGKVHGPQAIPESVDYNLFQGPAPLTGLNRVNLHYDWHWQWATGNGDMGNNAAHIIDDVRRIMGDDLQPKRVMSIGGRFGYDDDGETANSHISLMDYGNFPVFAEIRNLPRESGVDYMDNLRNFRSGTVVFCEDGYMFLGQFGVSAYSNDRKRTKAWGGGGSRGSWRGSRDGEPPTEAEREAFRAARAARVASGEERPRGGGGRRGQGAEMHAPNFIEAVRDQNPDLLNCPLKFGTLAGEIFHVANISYRAGSPASPDRIGKIFEGTQVGEEAWTSLKGNLERNGVDLEKEQLTLGSWMSLQDEGRKLQVEDPASDPVAQYLFQPRNYRSPFIVPAQV